MAATGNEAVTLAQLKEFASTIPSGDVSSFQQGETIYEDIVADNGNLSLGVVDIETTSSSSSFVTIGAIKGENFSAIFAIGTPSSSVTFRFIPKEGVKCTITNGSLRYVTANSSGISFGTTAMAESGGKFTALFPASKNMMPIYLVFFK